MNALVSSEMPLMLLSESTHLHPARIIPYQNTHTRQALSVCPLALEAVVPLLRLEVSRSEIWEKITADSSHADKLPWLSYWFHGTAEAVIGTLGGLEYWTAMERQYPDCHMTLLGLGEGYVAREQWLDAEFVFDQVGFCHVYVSG
jgi:hypothetical protein